MCFIVFDGYTGARGRSSEAEQVAGVSVRYAVNHWGSALKTHNTGTTVCAPGDRR